VYFLRGVIVKKTLNHASCFYKSTIGQARIAFCFQFASKQRSGVRTAFLAELTVLGSYSPQQVRAQEPRAGIFAVGGDSHRAAAQLCCVVTTDCTAHACSACTTKAFD
jgi:hypothetical protein